MITNSVKRGDIVFYDFGTKPGSDKSGLRPALVLQHDKFNTSSPTTIIAPIVPARKRKMCAHVLLEKRFGLLVDSMVFLEKMQIVDQEDIGDLIGHIDNPELMQLIDSTLIKVLNMKSVQGDSYLRLRVSTCQKKRKRRKKKKPAYNPRDIICLCPVCRNSYRHRGFRVINVGGPKDICDLCNYRTGVDYAVVGLLSR